MYRFLIHRDKRGVVQYGFAGQSKEFKEVVLTSGNTLSEGFPTKVEAEAALKEALTLLRLERKSGKYQTPPENAQDMYK